MLKTVKGDSYIFSKVCIEKLLFVKPIIGFGWIFSTSFKQFNVTSYLSLLKEKIMIVIIVFEVLDK